jgi:hypothetical protein
LATEEEKFTMAIFLLGLDEKLVSLSAIALVKSRLIY